MKLATFILYTLFFTTVGLSQKTNPKEGTQTFTMKGFVWDRTTGNPIEGAQVVHLASTKSAKTNKSGIWELAVPIEYEKYRKQLIEISKKGFEAIPEFELTTIKDTKQFKERILLTPEDAQEVVLFVHDATSGDTVYDYKLKFNGIDFYPDRFGRVKLAISKDHNRYIPITFLIEKRTYQSQTVDLILKANQISHSIRLERSTKKRHKY